MEELQSTLLLSKKERMNYKFPKTKKKHNQKKKNRYGHEAIVKALLARGDQLATSKSGKKGGKNSKNSKKSAKKSKPKKRRGDSGKNKRKKERKRKKRKKKGEIAERKDGRKK